jgi:large subunit ribosomal protein L9
MNIILKQDVEELGSKFDVVTVKDGYARNYLIPQGLAVAATASNMKVNDEVIRQQAHKAAKAKEAAQAIAEKLGALTLKLGAKAGESGKIFGSVNTIQLADAI